MTSTGTRRARPATMSRKALAATAAGALILGAGGAVIAATAAQADTTVTAGTFDWGFREAFRNYVGNQTGAIPPLGAAPAGTRVVPIAPAAFDTSATPGTVGNDETLPYTFPVTGEDVTSTTNLHVQAGGGVTYNFPSHTFSIAVANPAIVVNGSTKQIVADLTMTPIDSTGALGTPSTTNDVAVADVATVTTTVAGDGKSATITGTGATLTAAGATALNNYLSAGAAMDDFSASVTLEDPAGPAVPTVQVSKSVANPAGDTITVTGTGFDTSTTLGTRAPLNGQPAGTYVVFGTFKSPWQPSLGTATAPSSNRKVSTQKWAVPAASLATIDPSGSGAGIVLNPDGSFTTTLEVKRNFTGALADGNYGIYTYPGSGAVNAAFETYTPITWAAPTASAPGTGSLVNPGDEVTVQGTGFDAGEPVDVVLHSDPVVLDTLTADSTGAVSGTVEIPEDTELGDHDLVLEGQTSGTEIVVTSFTVENDPLIAYQTITTEVVDTGALTISVADHSVTLPSPHLSTDGTALETAGAINPVTVTDLRTADPGWTLTGTLTDFDGATDTIDNDGFSWEPKVVDLLDAGSDHVVSPGPAAGLGSGALLGSALADEGRGTAILGADVDLTLPTTTDPGVYIATLTLTAV